MGRLPWWLLILVALGCGETYELGPEAAGLAGESCRKAAHCADGLRCVDGVCITGGDGSGGDVLTEALRSTPGESCKRRADCEVGLACVDRVCVDTAVGAADDLRLGRRLESCVARNDCVLGLACLSERCIEPERVPAIATHECLAIECSQDAECCDGFVPQVPQLDCDMYAARCADGSPSAELYCAAFRVNCECARVCNGQRCVLDLACTTDRDCGVGGVLRCRGGRCQRCAADEDCAPGEVCRGGNCQSGCVVDEDCGALSACVDGRCTESPCVNDRDCQLLTGDPRSDCVGGLCDTPCAEDYECPAFHACQDGTCVFVGCETDAECRAYLSLHDLPPDTTTQAVCAPR